MAASLPWFRMYAEVAGDPVVQSLSFEDQRHYFIVLCLKCNGTLNRKVVPDQRERIVARGLGVDMDAALSLKKRLIEVALVDDKWQPKGWDKRQYNSDTSTDRVRKYRKTKDSGNASETHNETLETVTETPSTISVSVSVSDSVSKNITDRDTETAGWMFGLVRSLNPKHREPSISSWADDIRLMRERDKRADEEIRSLFEWANKHDFWKTNILSPGTLRRQWDKLVIQRDHPKPNRQATQAQPSRTLQSLQVLEGKKYGRA